VFAFMKRCLRCGIEQELDQFHRWSQRDGHQPWCKSCRKAYDAAYHQRVRERRKEQKRRKKEEFQAWYRAMKESLPCTDCGGCYHHAAMQFDHLPGFEKRGELGRVQRYASLQLVLDEIAKCEIVCANCHAVRTFERARGVAQSGRAPRLGRGGFAGSNPATPTARR
jgi:hypothetical protein